MKILVFGAHPDDFEIGMGGTILKYRELGYDVTGVIATLPESREIRRLESIKSSELLGINLEIMDMDFNDLFFSRKIVRYLDEIIRKYNPDEVYTHWNFDSHQDHNALTNGVIASTRKNNCSVFMYEQTIPGGIVPYSFHAQKYVDISNNIEKKEQSVLTHKSQYDRIGEWWIQGIKGRAMYRDRKSTRLNSSHYS